MLRLALAASICACILAEVVFIDDLLSDHARRNFGMPPDLNFNLRHSGGSVNLQLKENKRLNADAPIFVSEKDTRGVNRITRVLTPTSKVKHYQDTRHGAFMTVDCQPGPHGPCTRNLRGNIVINGKEYMLEPVTRSDVRYSNRNAGTPHSMKVLDVMKTSSHVNGKRTMLVNDVIAAPTKQQTEQARKSNERELDTLLARLDKMIARNTAETSGPVAHGIEMLLAIDHVIYKKFADLYPNADVKLRIREYYAHIINGVDMRYASIQEKDLSFYVTVAGYYISRKVDESPWMKYDVKNPNGENGLDFMIEWRKKEGLPKHDHAALMTGTDFATADGSINVVGLAFLDGVCQNIRVSLNEDLGFFQTSGVLAHELGHNLGAPHDSGEAGTPCSMDGDFIMQPYVSDLEAGSKTINPWRFSSCSINSFRKYVNSLGKESCTLNRAHIYNEKEFKLHTRGLAGQIYTEDQQCQLLVGGKSKACEGTTNKEGICRNFQCTSATSDACEHAYVAAHGTPCGNNKMCFEGLCVDAKTTKAPPKTTKAPPPPSSSKAPPSSSEATPSSSKATPSSSKATPSSSQAPSSSSQSPKSSTDSQGTGSTGVTDFPGFETTDLNRRNQQLRDEESRLLKAIIARLNKQ